MSGYPQPLYCNGGKLTDFAPSQAGWPPLHTTKYLIEAGFYLPVALLLSPKPHGCCLAALAGGLDFLKRLEALPFLSFFAVAQTVSMLLPCLPDQPEGPPQEMLPADPRTAGILSP